MRPQQNDYDSVIIDTHIYSTTEMQDPTYTSEISMKEQLLPVL